MRTRLTPPIWDDEARNLQARDVDRKREKPQTWSGMEAEIQHGTKTATGPHETGSSKEEQRAGVKKRPEAGWGQDPETANNKGTEREGGQQKLGEVKGQQESRPLPP